MQCRVVNTNTIWSDSYLPYFVQIQVHPDVDNDNKASGWSKELLGIYWTLKREQLPWIPGTK